MSNCTYIGDSKNTLTVPPSGPSIICNCGCSCKNKPPLLERDRLDYELPKLIDKFVAGWLSTCSSATVASTLLAAVAGGIFVHIEEKKTAPEPNGFPSSYTADALLIFSYLAVLANCSATITSFLISDRLVDVPLKAAENEELKSITVHEGTSVKRHVSDYIQWKLWPFFRRYWVLNLFIGFLCIFVEFVLYLWVFESSLAVRVAVTVCTVMGLLPFGLSLLFTWT